MRLSKNFFCDKELSEKIDEFNFQNTRKKIKNLQNELDVEKNKKVEKDYKQYQEMKETKRDLITLPLQVLGMAGVSAALAFSTMPELAIVGGVCTLAGSFLLYQEIKNKKEYTNSKSFAEFYNKLKVSEARDNFIKSLDSRTKEMEEEYQLSKA